MTTRAENIMCLFECDCATIDNMGLPGHHLSNMLGFERSV